MGLFVALYADEADSEEDESVGETLAQRMASREATRAVICVTRSGRRATNLLGYSSYKDMQLAGRKQSVVTVRSRSRTKGPTGHYDQCGKCFRRGILMICDGTDCCEAYHVLCVMGLTVAPPVEEKWYCPMCLASST